MKIEGPGPVRSTPVKRNERSRKTGSASFAKEFGSKAESVGSVSGAAPVHAVDALLAIQEVEDSTSGGTNARAREWGKDVLDRLEVIRLGLLAGGIPVSELRSIAALVARQQANVSDSRLKEILGEIELRARVELAKYDRDN